MLGHHRPASETPFKWRFAGGQMMAHLLNGVSLAGRWWPIYSDIWILYPLNKTKKQKTLSNLDPLWQNFLDPRMYSTTLFLSKKITKQEKTPITTPLSQSTYQPEAPWGRDTEHRQPQHNSLSQQEDCQTRKDTNNHTAITVHVPTRGTVRKRHRTQTATAELSSSARRFPNKKWHQ